MKLLSRQAINSQASEVRRQDIQEGTELAERLKAMRDALADLKNQQKNFVEASKEEIKRETTELYGQLESVKGEVKAQTAILEELKKPLTEEWNKLKVNQDKFATEQQVLNERKSNLDKQEVEVQEDYNNAKLALSKAQHSQKESDKFRDECLKAKEGAEEVLKVAQNVAKTLYEKANEREKEVSLKEEKVNFDLKANENVANINKAKEQELNERERAINDKYAQLLKTTEDVKHTKRPKSKTSSSGNT